MFFDRERVNNMATLAVLPLENMSNSPGATQAVADMLAASLQNSNRFRLVERADQYGQAETGAAKQIDRIAAREIGRRLEVDGVLYGAITEYGSLSELPERGQDSVFGLQLRLLDVRSGIIVWSSMINRTSEKSLFRHALSASELALVSTRELVTEFDRGSNPGVDSGDGNE